MLNTADLLVQRFQSAFDDLGFRFFTKGDYNLNLISVRSERSRAGYYDDALYCFYKVSDVWRAHMWCVTTDPGRKLIINPAKPEGTAILASPQQMNGAYLIGFHKHRSALIQHGAAVKVWRDGNKDDILDWQPNDPGKAGWYGINIHNNTSAPVLGMCLAASMGCTVFAVDAEHKAMMDLCRVAAATYGERFTYTIIETKHLQ